MCGRNVLLRRTCWEPFSPSASRLNGREKVTGCPEKKGKIQIESPGVLLHRIVPATKDQMASRPFVTRCQLRHPLAFIDSLVFIQSGNEKMLRCERARCEPCALTHAVIGTVTQLLWYAVIKDFGDVSVKYRSSPIIRHRQRWWPAITPWWLDELVHTASLLSVENNWPNVNLSERQVIIFLQCFPNVCTLSHILRAIVHVSAHGSSEPLEASQALFPMEVEGSGRCYKLINCVNKDNKAGTKEFSLWLLLTSNFGRKRK